MDKAQVKELCQTILQERPPLRVVNTALNFLVQSRHKIFLKPDKEHARSYVCCVLAIQELQDEYGYEPEPKNPPLPPKQFDLLVAQFERELLDAQGGSDSDDDFDTGEAVPRTPTKSPRKSPQKSANASRAPSTPSSSPRKLKRNEKDFKAAVSRIKRHKADDEKDEFVLFRLLQQALDLPLSLVRTMATYQQQYKEHVLDHWGLAMAIAHTIIFRAEPDKSIGLERLIVQTARCSQPKPRLDAMMPWAQKVLNSEPELAQLAVVAEEVPKFYGGAGAWSFELEPEQWWTETEAKAAV